MCTITSFKLYTENAVRNVCLEEIEIGISARNINSLRYADNATDGWKLEDLGNLILKV